MSINSKSYAFTEDNVNNAPENHGVYELYKNGALNYIGRASGNGVTIRTRLQSHRRGDDGSCTKAATQYKREVCDNPIAREKELLAEYKQAHGRLPSCNDRTP